MRLANNCTTGLAIDRLVKSALAEDIGSGDCTTSCLVDPGAQGCAAVTAKEPLVLAGLMPFRRVFELLSPGANVILPVSEGASVAASEIVAEVSGPLDALLAGERTALNFLQRLSGIATLTRQFVERIGEAGAVLLDTRKTTPGLRVLEKQAVRSGGGMNHRMGLFDAVLIKDNHIAVCGGIRTAVERARKARGPHTVIEVEVRTLTELADALTAGPDMIMLDNMNPEELRQAVARVGGRVPLEASGNVTIETVGVIAATGVDYISAGAVTHSARAVDLSMQITPDR